MDKYRGGELSQYRYRGQNPALYVLTDDEIRTIGDGQRADFDARREMVLDLFQISQETKGRRVVRDAEGLWIELGKGNVIFVDVYIGHHWWSEWIWDMQHLLRRVCRRRKKLRPPPPLGPSGAS
jgi:hypothetical protein